MKTTGIVLTTLGVLMILSSVKLALTKYDLGNGDDLSKLISGAAVALLVVVLGLSLIKKARDQPTGGKN